MDAEVRERLSAVLRKWVALSDEEAQVAMEFAAGERAGNALVITGPIGSGKSWLAEILRTIAPELVVVDAPGIEARDMAAVKDMSKTLVIAVRDVTWAEKFLGTRAWTELRHSRYCGSSFGRLEEVREEVNEIMGRNVAVEKMTRALRVWAEQEHIKPAGFAETTGYSYQHSYNLLKGGGKVSDETLGRISRTYGADAVREIMVLERGV